MGYIWLGYLAFGVIARVTLSRSILSSWCEFFPEINVPNTSWRNAVEGVALFRKGISPYDGDLFHEAPLMLRFLRIVMSLTKGYELFVFIMLDVLIAIILSRIVKLFSKYMLTKQKCEVGKYSPEASDILLQNKDFAGLGYTIIIMYLCNPYTILSCLSKSTAIFQNLTTVLIFYYTLAGNMTLSCFFLALATYLSLYPVTLLVPAAIFFAQREIGDEKLLTRAGFKSMLSTVGTFLIFLSLLLLSSYYLENQSWQFIYSTYGFILSVPDLSPNLGLFWYFFTEMFDHFRIFFIWVFQINVFIYTAPLAVRLRFDPIFCMYIQLFIISIFKSYPSYADVSICFNLLPLWSFFLRYFRSGLYLTFMYIVSGFLAPIMWNLWIGYGKANANFYFAVSLVFSTAQILLMTDVLIAYLKHNFHLHHGLKPKTEGGAAGLVVLD